MPQLKQFLSVTHCMVYDHVNIQVNIIKKVLCPHLPWVPLFISMNKPRRSLRGRQLLFTFRLHELLGWGQISDLAAFLSAHAQSPHSSRTKEYK